jgi:hypothetical protein
MVKYKYKSTIMSFYPTKYKDYGWIKEKKYTIHDLVSICDFFNYSIKRRNKTIMLEDCHQFLRNGHFACRIQRCWKKRILYALKKTQGPAIFNRSLCNNTEDFLTTESMNEIDYYFFISIKDQDFIYGFNIISVYNLLKKTKHSTPPLNPYTRNPFTKDFIDTIYKRMKLNYLLKQIDHPIYHEIQLPSYDNKITGLFQKIDSLGNYTQIEWFVTLDTRQLRRFMLELKDIWEYRAQLTSSMKIQICPPLGKPFIHVPLHIMETSTPLDIHLLRNYCYLVMDELLNKSDSVEHQSLGSYYILCALTLVNQEAADALPWLYQSVL